MKKIFYLFFISICLYSNNIFSQWIQQSSGTTERLNDCYFVNSNTGWIVSQLGNVRKTIDGGNTWSAPQNLDNTNLYGIYFFNENLGWIAGRESIWKTINGGNNWVISYPIAGAGGWLYSFSFVDQNTGWVCGDVALLKTTNGGNNWIDQWQNQTTILSHDINSIKFINSNTGWTAGCCEILKTTNGGNNWINVNLVPFSTLHSIFFVNANQGWTVGINGKILTTTNSGNNWTIQNVNTNLTLRSTYFSDINTGWISGGNYGDSSCVILKTTNGGNTWGHQTTNVRAPLYSIRFVNNNTGWAVGDYGTILKTTNGGGSVGIQNIGTTIPDKFSLSQNYPNPFNPTTNIEFSIQEKSFVKLKVFDISGKEIQELINENFNPGTYKYDFNAESLPSGTYFYRLETEKFSETKKMVVLK